VAWFFVSRGRFPGSWPGFSSRGALDGVERAGFWFSEAFSVGEGSGFSSRRAPSHEGGIKNGYLQRKPEEYLPYPASFSFFGTRFARA
jgi:hypothetical protein